MIRRLLVVLLLLPLLAPPVLAQGVREMRKQVEASMLVTGSVDVDRDGKVTAHVLDHPGKLPPYVVDLVGRAVPALRFEPILSGTEPVLARARMSLRLVATPTGEGGMKVAIRSAHFGDGDLDGAPSPNDTSRLRAVTMKPPRYPLHVVQLNGQGTVYLLLKIGRDGIVEDLAAEQVNLTAIGGARQMDAIRSSLAKAAFLAARAWKFAPPTTGDGVSAPYWVARVPVDFHLRDHPTDDAMPDYGQWRGYLPGPQSRPSWARPDPPGFSPDALVAGAVHDGTTRFRLLTPLEG